jgi:hypothetical protein
VHSGAPASLPLVNIAFRTNGIAWRLQALAEGDLTERARGRAHQMARDSDLRIVAPPDFLRSTASESGPCRGTGTAGNRIAACRCPALCSRKWKGRTILVEVGPGAPVGFDVRHLRNPLYHHDEQHVALIPPAQPAYLPAINVIAQLDRPKKPQESRVNLHSALRTCMALPEAKSQR